MLPVYSHSPAGPENLKKPKTPTEIKTTFNSVLSRVSPTHRTLLFVVILFQVFLVVYITRSPSSSTAAADSPPLLTPPDIHESVSVLTLPPPDTLESSKPLSHQTEIDQSETTQLPEIEESGTSESDTTHLPEVNQSATAQLPEKPEIEESGMKKLSTAVSRQPEIEKSDKPQLQQSGNRSSDECKSGTIYVYDLPPMFNTELKDRCNELDPWNSKCDANLNDGYGPEAKQLAGIVPKDILPAWYWTDHYWGEVVYHNRVLNYRCRTLDPESATAFYIPFYVGLAVGNYLWGYHSAKERDFHSEMMLKWVVKQPWWRRSNGSDHIIMLGRLTWDFRRLPDAEDNWGTSLLNMPEMQNVIRLSVEKNPWDNLEVAVPYPTIFHPRTDSDLLQWQQFVRNRRRTHLFSFVGGARKSIKNDFRGLLQDQCQNGNKSCIHVDCSRESCLDGTTAIMKAFLTSDFCLQPRGDGFTRRSVFDCMMAGSIPVFFWNRTAYIQYEWFVPDQPESYSVFIDHNNVRNGTNIKKVLEKFTRKQVKKMREKVIEYIPRFVYARPFQGLPNTKDAFDIAIEGVLNKYKDHMQSGRRGLLNR